MQRFLFGILQIVLCVGSALSQEDVEQLEQHALFAAASEAANSVVRIETIGGLERVGQVLVNAGPTSGVIVDPEGYVISSAYNFIQQPSSIIVQLPNGKRKAAEIVSRDHGRRLVLLKVTVDEPLRVPQFAPKADLRVGQWAVAVGRTLPGDDFNMSVGIVSAKNRIWSRAIQTDANVSPANYGGALADIEGRTIGVLVPLSPDSTDVLTGAEWYDSGIGFAVPFEDIIALFDRLKASDLYPGKLGISLKGNDAYGAEPVVGVCRPKSPARDAGIKAGDKIVEINGIHVRRHVEIQHVLGPLLAGDTIRLEFERDGASFTKEVKLVDKLLPYEHAFLGILPTRTTVLDEAAIDGVVVRYVYAESSAAKSGLEAGDIITTFIGQAVEDAATLRIAIAGLEPNDEAELKFRRDDATEVVKVTLGSLPSNVPENLPALFPNVSEFNEDLPPLGKINIKLPEEVGECQAYIPETYDARFAHSLLVLLPLPGQQTGEAVIRDWHAECDQSRTVLLVPQAKEARSWLPTETAFIRKTIENLRRDYNIDSERIVVHGAENSGAMAFLTAFTHRDLIRGVSAVNSPVPSRAPGIFNEPMQRLAAYIAVPKDRKMANRIAANIKQLRAAKIPVTEKGLGKDVPFDRVELFRWIDALDRL